MRGSAWRHGRCALAFFLLFGFAISASAQVPRLRPGPSILEPNAPLPGIQLKARAVLSGGSRQPLQGIAWRVFGADNESGLMQVHHTVRSNQLSMLLVPGNYIVVAGFGLATGSRRIRISDKPLVVEVPIDAAGIVFSGAVGADSPIANGEVSFDLYRKADTPSGIDTLVLKSAPQHTIFRVPPGRYHVVSRFGSANAVVRSDLTVAHGQLADARIHHRAGRLTLRLKNSQPDAPLAGTTWAVVTPGGDPVVEFDTAVPSTILNAGSYIVYARHKNAIYSNEISVESGKDATVELLVNPGEVLDPGDLTRPGVRP